MEHQTEIFKPAHFRRLIDSLTEGVQVISSDWRYLYVNKELVKQSKYTEEQLLGNTIMSLYPGIEETYMFSLLQLCMEKRENQQMENEFTYPDGTAAWFNLHMQPFPEGVVIISRDITEEKKNKEKLGKLHSEFEKKVIKGNEEISAQNEELQVQQEELQSQNEELTKTLLALEQSEAKTIELLESMLEGFAHSRIITNEDGIPVDWEYLYLNPAYETQTGFKISEFVGKKISELVPEVLQDRSKWLERYGNVALTGEPTTFVDYSEPLNRWYQVSVYSPEKGEFASVFRNITKEKEASKRLGKLNKAINEIKDYAILLLDAKGTILNWNKGAKRIKGYSANEIIGKNFKTFYREEDKYAGKPESLLDKAIQTGQAHDEGWRVRKNGTTFWANVTITSFYDDDGEIAGFSKVTHDLTEKRNVQQKLELQNKELESFSYSVSHDLRAPLRAITGFSNILREDHFDELSKEGQRVVGIISKNAKRMGQLIDDILAFSRLNRQDLHMVTLHMETLFSEVYQELLIDKEKNREIDFEIGKLKDAEGDRTMIQQVVINLVSNALKYTRPRKKAVIKIKGEETSSGYVYSIQDNGVGFDERHKSKLFDVFQRLHKAKDFEGTGVGLAIVQRVIHRHGGRVWGKSKDSEGAAFYFTLHENEGS